MTDGSNPLRLSYTDNAAITVADRLAAELAHDPSRLWVVSGYFGASMWAAVGKALLDVGQFRLVLGKDYELKNLDAGNEERRIADLVRQAIELETSPALPSRGQAEQVAELIGFLERQQAAGEPVVKLWMGDGFLHAKAYVMKHSVGIGSANLTYPGLINNRELVGWRQDYTVVAEVAEWFRGYWEDPLSVDHTDALLEVLRSAPLISNEYTPHDVLIKVLAARYGIDRPPSLEQASFNLKWFQEDAVFRLIRLLDGRAHGALLADAVGLGKTYMALGVIHHFLYQLAERRRGQGKPVLLLIPRSLRKMWEGALEEAGLDWACRIVTLQSLRDDFDTSPYEGAELVVIDEAHRLRGGGTWFRKAVDLVAAGGRTDRRVLMLTATPLNTGIDDLINELRILTKNRRDVWAPDVADFERHLRRVDKKEADPFPVLDRSLVRRSRGDILRAQDEAAAAGIIVDRVTLPNRRALHVDYQYGGHPDLFSIFSGTLRSLELAPYDLERFLRDDALDAVAVQQDLAMPDLGVDLGPVETVIRPGSLAALVAVGLLVRFQSSLEAIRVSLRRLDAVLHRYDEGLATNPPRLLDLRSDRDVRRLLADEAHEDADAGSDEDADVADALDDAWARVLETAPLLAEPDRYNVAEIRASIARDRARVRSLSAALPGRDGDGKVAALIGALERTAVDTVGAPSLLGRTVLLFTQFRDTAAYLESHLQGRFRVARIDGGVDSDRRESITAWFDPARRGEREVVASATGERPPDILISTDVLAEGHNLQLADCVINFDLHFNPQVAVQRCGRVDRLGSPHPLVHLVSFLPPEPLERHLGLLLRLDERFRRIHGFGLGDERVTTIAGDSPSRTLEQMRRLYQQDDASVLDDIERSWTLGSTDYMRQPLDTFLQRAGRDRVERIPFGVSSVRKRPAGWTYGPGTFIAFGGPRNRDGRRESYWRFYPRTSESLWGQVVIDEVAIFRAIACRENEPRVEDPHPTPGPTAIDWDLLRESAERLASQLTLERSTAQISAGASERSRRLRNELRANLSGLDITGTDELLERLLQIRVEDYDGRAGWSRFDEARRRLRRASSAGERREAGLVVAEAGVSLLGLPVATGPTTEIVEVRPTDLQLIAYEVLV